ncbi:Ankyrin repeat [Spirosomataceae bacterium TFI 002]|nr:Ankyrin repeat [Spirosomataceae bacterium TFI 002]
MNIKNSIKVGLSLLIALFFSGNIFAQSKNVFHDRGFWAKKPSIETIESKILAGNDILEMGPSGWDGTLLAIMADLPLETVKYLLDKGPDVNQMTHHSNNYLMWTAMKGNLPVMELLLEKGSRTDLINSHGQSLLMHVAQSGKADKELYEFCLENGADIVNDRDENGKNVAQVAIGRLDDLSFLDYFVEKGLDLDAKDKDGNGLFHSAVSSGNINKLKGLVAKGISYQPNLQTGENAFNFVGGGRSATVSLELLTYLKSLGLNPANVTNTGQSALHNLAGRAKDTSIFDFFINAGLNPNTANADGDTPLLLAVSRGSKEVVSYWLNKTDNINASNVKGLTPLALAVEGNNGIDVLDLLIAKGNKITWQDKQGNNLTFLLTNSFRGGLNDYKEKLQFLKDKGVTTKGQPLLHIAIEKGEFELLQYLLESGLDINQVNANGYTPLHFAAMNSKDTTILQYLVDKGANTQQKTEFEETVYDLASENEALGNSDINFLKASK